MQRSPDVNYTTIAKEISKSKRTLAGHIKNIDPTTVKGSVKDRVKVPANYRRHGRINLIRTISEKVIPPWIPIRRIKGNNTKSYTVPLKVAQDKAAFIIKNSLGQNKDRPVEDNRPTGVGRSRGCHSQKTIRGKPSITLGTTGDMSLL